MPKLMSQKISTTVAAVPAGRKKPGRPVGSTKLAVAAAVPKVRKKPGRAVNPNQMQIVADICKLVEQGESLNNACKLVPGARIATIMDWCDKNSDIAESYAQACQIRYRLLADEILDIASRTTATTTVHAVDKDGKSRYDSKGQPILVPVHVPLNSDVNAHIKLQVDTRKWFLSKVLPKVYGDKVTQEHTGKDGGAIQIAAMDFKGLSDSELEAMRTLMLKANGAV